MSKIVKNFFYQSIFQLTKIIIPIVTIPIVSNAIGPKGLGIYSYTNSIAQYFVLIGGLGVSLYGNREIALSWAKKKNINKTFWEIFWLKAMVTAFVLLAFLILTLFTEYKEYFIAQSLVIISVLFDISWFFMGIEDFKKTSLSNLMVQIITFILIVLLIKNEKDTLLYTFIQTTGILSSQLSVWFFLKKYITFQKVKIKDSLNRFKESVAFFIPQAAIMLYTNLNKTILGILIGSTAVGYYTSSLQLNNVFITLITTLDVVLLPHMSSLFANKNLSKIITLMDKTIDLQLFFSIPIMFGVLIVQDKLVPWFFGEKFMYITSIIPLFSILIVIIPLGMSISRQYLMPIGRINEYNKSVFGGAVINIVSNIILIPKIGFIGVVISNILAEVFVTSVRTMDFLKSTNFKFNTTKITKYLISSLAMFCITRFITRGWSSTFITNLVQVGIAVLCYLVLTYILKVNILYSMLRNKRYKEK